MKKIVTVILLLCVVLTFAACADKKNTPPEITMQEIYDACRIEAMLQNHQSVYVQSAMDDGVSKVVTSTGFTFDDAGMTVEKSGSEMKTQITENGMSVYQNSAQVLTANNKGVDARNLHATTYLIVGNNSRFEDYGYDRTGCFWIGG